MKLSVKLFARAKDLAGMESVEVDLPEAARVDHSRRNEFDVGMVQQLRIFLLQTDRRRRLAAHDGKSFAGQFGEFADVAFGNVARRGEVAGGDHRHSGRRLSRGDVDANTVVPEHGNERVRQFGVVVIRIFADEIHDRRFGCARLGHPPATAIHRSQKRSPPRWDRNRAVPSAAPCRPRSARCWRG